MPDSYVGHLEQTNDLIHLELREVAYASKRRLQRTIINVQLAILPYGFFQKVKLRHFRDPDRFG